MSLRPGVLLDSHVLLWVLADDPQLGPRARELILSGPCFVSGATTWELAIKAALGKVDLPPDWADAVAASGVGELPIRHVHAYALDGAHVLPHRDPFDRMLLVQSQVEGLILLTADRRILSVADAHVRDARV